MFSWKGSSKRFFQEQPEYQRLGGDGMSRWIETQPWTDKVVGESFFGRAGARRGQMAKAGLEVFATKNGKSTNRKTPLAALARNRKRQDQRGYSLVPLPLANCVL